MRRLTREQRGDVLSERAFDNFVGSPRNLGGTKLTLDEQTAHGERWTRTPGCKACMRARRGYHHTKACVARKQAFLVAKARAKELRAAEAETWRRPSSSARDEGVRPEPVDAEQRDVPDSDPRKPDSDATKRVRISTKRSDPGELNDGAPRSCALRRNSRVRFGR